METNELGWQLLNLLLPYLIQIVIGLLAAILYRQLKLRGIVVTKSELELAEKVVRAAVVATEQAMYGADSAAKQKAAFETADEFLHRKGINLSVDQILTLVEKAVYDATPSVANGQSLPKPDGQDVKP